MNPHSLLLGKVTSKVSKVLQRNNLNDRKGEGRKKQTEIFCRGKPGKESPFSLKAVCLTECLERPLGLVLLRPPTGKTKSINTIKDKLLY